MRVDTRHTIRRQWTLLRLLPRWPQTCTARGLAAQLAADGYPTTHRTIERDLQALLLDLPLHVDDSRKPFRWSWAKDANAEFMPRLSASQSLALKIVQKHAVTPMPQIMLDDLQPLFQMADRELRHTGWKDWADRIEVVPPMLALIPPELDAAVLADVHAALAQRRILVAMYNAVGKPAPERMRIHPLGLVLRSPVQYLACTIEGRKRVRTLVLHRMQETTVEAMPCEEPAGFDFASFAATLAIRPRGIVRLHLRFENDAGQHVRETKLSKAQKCTVLGPGTIEIRATRQLDDQLFWWLMKFGSNVEVLKPVGLRREIAAEHAKAAAKYVRPESPMETSRIEKASIVPGRGKARTP